MIRRSLLPIALLAIISFLAGCGGTGSSSMPGGVNSSVPSIVQLLTVQQVVQTNSSVLFKAKVLDGNGSTIAGVPVVFTNLSLLGVLSSTTATTDSQGYATVSLFSTDSGFATIQAEVNSGTGKVRDKRTVFFSVFDLAVSSALPTLTLAVDNNNDGSFNDPSDFFLTSGEAIVRATVLDRADAPILGDTVTFGADSTEVTFPDGNIKTTNSDGQAFARVKVVPSESRTSDTPVNITAVSLATGAFNVITLFVTEIEVGQVLVAANPSTVASGGTSTITATVLTTIGTPLPDGTMVNFSASAGTIAPFAATTKGVATVQWTAPTVTANQGVTITGSVGSKSGSTSVAVTAPLTISLKQTIVQGAAPIDVVTGNTVSGGAAPYTITAACTTGVAACNDLNGTAGCGTGDTFTWSTSPFTVTIGAEGTQASLPGTCTFTAKDFAGATATATLTIQ